MVIQQIHVHVRLLTQNKPIFFIKYIYAWSPLNVFLKGRNEYHLYLTSFYFGINFLKWYKIV